MVVRRTREIGIRLALGAQTQDVLRMVVLHGMGLILVGFGIGLVGVFGLSRFLASLLYGIQATGLSTLAAVSTGLISVALLSFYIPARRAMRIDPMISLRYE